MQGRIKAARTWAMENYENGGDIIVEATTDAELIEIFGLASSEEEAVAAVSKHCGIFKSYADDIRGAGGCFDEERAEAALKEKEARLAAQEYPCPGYCRPWNFEDGLRMWEFFQILSWDWMGGAATCWWDMEMLPLPYDDDDDF